MEEYLHQPMDGKPFPPYTLARAAALDMEAVCERCNAKCDDDIIKQTRPAPVTPTNRFVDQPLKEVIDFHRNVIQNDDWDKLYFAVVTEDDWAEKGLLLVTLGFNTECRPDAFFLPAEDVGITLLNLQVGTTDWEETRYGYESHNDSNKNDDPDDIKSNDQGDSSSARGSREHDGIKIGQANASNKDEAFIDGDQSSCFLVYNGNSPPQTAGLVLDVLDPEWQKKYCKAGERFVEGRIPWSRGYKTPSHEVKFVWCSDPWSEAIAQHPACCQQQEIVTWRGKTIKRNIDKRFFVYCDEAFEKYGSVWLSKMDWDGDTSRDDQQIWDVVAEDAITVEREGCLAKNAYARLCAVSAGLEDWKGQATAHSQTQIEKPVDFGYWA